MIEIPLSKKGKHAGKYVAIVDDCDADLAELSWCSAIASNGIGIYARRAIRNSPGEKQYYIHLHRVIMERALGRPLEKNEMVDHVDTNGLNCSRENLRLATYEQNAMNRNKSSANKTGFKGVSFSGLKKNPYRALIYVDGKKVSLGCFPTLELAYAAYCEAQEVYHKNFANKG